MYAICKCYPRRGLIWNLLVVVQRQGGSEVSSGLCYDWYPTAKLYQGIVNNRYARISGYMDERDGRASSSKIIRLFHNSKTCAKNSLGLILLSTRNFRNNHHSSSLVLENSSSKKEEKERRNNLPNEAVFFSFPLGKEEEGYNSEHGHKLIHRS